MTWFIRILVVVILSLGGLHFSTYAAPVMPKEPFEEALSMREDHPCSSAQRTPRQTTTGNVQQSGTQSAVGNTNVQFYIEGEGHNVTYLEGKKHQSEQQPCVLTSNLVLPKVFHDKLFVPRQGKIEEIKKGFEVSPVVIIVGPEGTGKTILAYDYIRKTYKVEYPYLQWLEAESADKILMAYQNLAQNLGLSRAESQEHLASLTLFQSRGSRASPRSIEEEYQAFIQLKVRGFLEKCHNVILAFNNVEEGNVIERYLASLSDNVHALLTTRHANLLNGVPSVRLDAFTHDEARLYLEQALPTASQKDIKEIIKHIGKLPIELDWVVNYIRSYSFIEIKDLLDEIKEKKKEMEDPLFAMLTNTVRIRSEIAWKLLHYTPFLDISFIPLEMIFKLAARIEKQNERDLRFKKNVSLGLGVLEGLSLIEEKDTYGVRGLTLHSLAQEKAGDLVNILPMEELKEIGRVLFTVLNDAFPEVEDAPYATWKRAELYMPHGERLLESLERRNFEAKDYEGIAPLLGKLGKFYTEVTPNPAKARRYFQEAIEITERARTHYPLPYVAKYLNSLGEVSRDQQEYERAFDSALKAYKIRLELYKDYKNHPDLANSLYTLGTIYLEQGNLDKAYNHLKRSLRMLQEIYPEEPNPAIAKNLYQLGLLYQAQGDIGHACTYAQQALATLQGVYPEQNHPYIVNSLTLIGSLYFAQQNWTEALEYYQQAVDMQQELYPDRINGDIILQLSQIGKIYLYLEKKEKAQEYFAHAYKKAKENLGEEDPLTKQVLAILHTFPKAAEEEQRESIDKSDIHVSGGEISSFHEESGDILRDEITLCAIVILLLKIIF